MGSSDSDYDVEDYVKPDRVIKSINDERADLVGNFDDEKRAEILNGICKDGIDGEVTDIDTDAESNTTDISDDRILTVDSSAKLLNNENKAESQKSPDKEEIDENEEHCETTMANNDHMNGNDADEKPKAVLTKEQLMRLRRGTKKADRYVLYVTNLNFNITPGILKDYFNTVGKVRSIRIPKRKRGGFAFVEMDDLDSYQRALDLHNTELMGRSIKIQYSEAGNKRSANKKNILKQKNRKLAEMRHEYKLFTKSGKFYDKALKKEKAQNALMRRPRQKPSSCPL